MKKFVSLILSLLMLMSLFSVGAFAEEEEKSETISFEETNNKETRHFILTAQRNDGDGWYAGNRKTLTITSKYNSIIITRVEAVIGEYGSHYGLIQTDGTKRETGNVNIGDTVHIDNIDSNTFSVSNGGIYYIQFKDITVFYKEVSHTHSYRDDNTCINCGLTKCEAEGHSYNENNTCINCGLTKCEAEGHSYNENNTCINCGLTKCEAEGHSYNENNTCINCGLTKCEIEGHSYKHGFCTFCGHKYKEELFETIGFETTNNKETAHFNLTAQSYDGNGWYGGYNYFPLTITAKDSNIIITRIEADVGFYGNLYHKVGTSKGNKRENGPVNDGDTVHIDNINSNTFSFSGGTDFIQFKDITVFYENRNTSAPIEDGYYIIRSAVDPNYCLDIDGGENAKSEGDNLHLWPVNSAKANIFEIKKDGEAYQITATHSGMVLDVEGNTTGEGVNIYQWTDYDTNNQRWIFNKAPGENCYYIHSALVGEAIWMDADSCVNGTMPKEDTNVQIWSYTGANNQMWILEKVDAPSGFTLSQGNIWIIAGIAVVAVVAISVVVAKKKKKVTE